MNFQQTKDALVEAGFKLHMKIGLGEHYWMNDIHIMIMPRFFCIEFELFSLDGGLDEFNGIKREKDYIIFNLGNKLHMELPTGGGE